VSPGRRPGSRRSGQPRADLTLGFTGAIAPATHPDPTTCKEKAVTTNLNHARVPRKSLGEQIDRLDGILDGLAEALNGAVADAVRDAVGLAVRQAVESTVRELLGQPQLLRAALALHQPPEPPAAPEEPAQRRTLKGALLECLKRLLRQAGEHAAGARARLRGTWSSCLARIKAACTCVQGRCRRLCEATAGAFGLMCRLARLLWECRRGCLLAVAAGAIAGAGGYHAGPLLAGLLSGLSGAALSAAGMVLWPLRRLTRGGGTSPAGA
jgi:hypothetical protein